MTDGVEIDEYVESAVACRAIAKFTPNVATSARATPSCVARLRLGGTSEGAPAWAGMAALADQYAHHPLGSLNPAIYKIGKSSQYHQAFHDITTGNNSSVVKGRPISGYNAGPGWDPVTGWGSPNAGVLVPLLAQGG